MKLAYKKMLEEINKLVQSDFCMDMEFKQMPNAKPYTQREALEMSDLLEKVYLISHCLTCSACQSRFRKGKGIRG